MTSYIILLGSWSNKNNVVVYNLETEIRYYDQSLRKYFASRRFTEFSEMYKKVLSLKIIPLNRIPKFPLKSVFNKDLNVIEQRIELFNELLQVFSLYRELMNTMLIKNFLQLPPFDEISLNGSSYKTDMVTEEPESNKQVITFQKYKRVIRKLEILRNVGTTFVCHDTVDGQTIVVKRYQIKSREQCLSVLGEIACMRTQDNTHMAEIHDAYYFEGKNNQFLYILMPYYKHGSLNSFINARLRQPFPEKIVVDIFLQLISALTYLHEHSSPILQRNLSSNKILIPWSLESGAIKVVISSIDTVKEGKLVPIKQIDRCEFWAPEVESRREYSIQSDTWTIGIILLQLMTFHAGIIDVIDEGNQRLTPISALITDEKSEVVCHRLIKQKMKLNGYSDELIDSVLSTLRYDLKERISLSVARTIVQRLIFSSSAPNRSKICEIFCYGRNYRSELGVGHNQPVVQPSRQVARIQEIDVVSVVVGDCFSLFLTQNGEVYSVGRNEFGELGLGEKSKQIEIPTKIHALDGIKIVDLAAGSGCCSLALCDTGEIFGWGRNEAGQLLLGHCNPCRTPEHIIKLDKYKIRKIYTSGDQTDFFYILTVDGDLYSWGHNALGQLGIGEPFNSWLLEPTKVNLPNNNKVTSISLGKDFCIIVDEEARTYSHGEGSRGQLGHGDREMRSIPTAIRSLQKYRIIQVSTALHSSFALSNDGSVLCWGENSYGTLGLGHIELHVLEPQYMSAFTGMNVIKISCGSYHAMALIEGGIVMAWGLPSDENQEYVTQPQEITMLKSNNVWDISAGFSCSFILCD